MAGEFDHELREQLAQARRALLAAEQAGDDDDADSHRGRIAGLIRMAARHGIVLPHTPEEELAD